MLRTYLKKYSSLLVIIFCVIYIFFSQKNPCTSPITYKIGRFDTQFGISQKEFLQTIYESADIWNISLGKKILIYDPKGELTINLIYDDRQKTTQTNAMLQADATKIHGLANATKAQYLALEYKHTLLEKEYLEMLTTLQRFEDTHNTQVAYWNSVGGAPDDIYAKLISDQETIINNHSILENKRVEVNTLVEQINTFIHTYNLLLHKANSTIDTINLSAGKEFEEGMYDPTKNAITIYEFSTPKKLTRVITHELGHALLLPHNDNPQSIMYPINQANTLTLSKEDSSALELRCKAFYPFIDFYSNLKERLVSFLP